MRKYALTITLLLIIAAFAWPHPAHAADIWGTVATGTKTVVSSVLDVLEAVLGTVDDLLTKLLGWLGTNLQNFLTLPITTGGFAVYSVWKIVRDICNMFFLLLLIAVAFGTIFNTLHPNPFHWRGALVGILIAAVAINFSLAVGQTIVTFGNLAASRVIALFGGTQVSTRVGAKLNLGKLVQGGVGIAGSDNVPPPQDTATGQLTPNQRAAVESWTKEGFQSAQIILVNCVQQQQKPTVGECFELANKTAFMERAADRDYTSAAFDEKLAWTSDAIRVLINSGPTGLGAASAVAAVEMDRAISAERPFLFGAATNDTRDIPTKLTTIANILLRVFMLVVLNIAFLFVCVFMAVRLPIIWFLLAVSAPAFLAIAVPQSHAFKQWLNNMVGWSIFGPLYLLNIYLGLYLLDKQNVLLASIATEGGNIPAVASFAPLLFFAIACAIFSFGAAWCLKFSFGLISVGGGVLKGTASYFGMDEAGGYGLKTAARVTGLTSRYEGAAAGLGAVYQRNVTQPLARRDEDVRARYQARFGDPRAMERLNRQRVDEDIKSKKYKSVDDVTAAMAKLSPEGRKYLLKEVEKNDPMLAAKLAAQGHYFDSNGNKLTADQVLARNATRMSTEDWSSYLTEVASGKMTLSPEMEGILRQKVRKPDQLAQLRAAASGNAQALALINNAVAAGQQGRGRGAGPRPQAPRNIPTPGGRAAAGGGAGGATPQATPGAPQGTPPQQNPPAPPTPPTPPAPRPTPPAPPTPPTPRPPQNPPRPTPPTPPAPPKPPQGGSSSGSGNP